MGKPAPKAEVMRFLKGKEYADAKDFAGECEPVVVIAKGQSMESLSDSHLFLHNGHYYILNKSSAKTFLSHDSLVLAP